MKLTTKQQQVLQHILTNLYSNIKQNKVNKNINRMKAPLNFSSDTLFFALTDSDMAEIKSMLNDFEIPGEQDDNC